MADAGALVHVYMRSITLEVVVPASHVWEFMERFGRTFPRRDSHAGTEDIGPVDDYFEHPNGWHVTVTVPEFEEEKFHAFLRKFAAERGLPYEEYDSTL